MDDQSVYREAFSRQQIYFQWWLLQQLHEMNRRLFLSYLPDHSTPPDECDESIIVKEQ